MHECIRKLLVQTDDESLECLCRLVTTVGHLLDQETAAVLSKGGQAGFSNLDEYFASMNKLVSEKKLSSRVRFLMQVTMSLRRCSVSFGGITLATQVMILNDFPDLICSLDITELIHRNLTHVCFLSRM